MSRPALPLVLVAFTLAALVVGCRDDKPSRPVPEGPAETPPAPQPEPSPADQAERAVEEAKKKWDEDARGLLKSFEARAYDPRRDGRLNHAAGTLRVRAGGQEAAYRFVFDSGNPAEKPVAIDPVAEPEGWNPDLTRKARAWAVQACAGAFAVVAFYRPPIPLAFTPSIDKKNLIVTAPPFRGPLSVSYSFDDRQVVTIRGEWTDEQNRSVTNYDWDFFHGRYMLRRETVYKGAIADFEYDDRHGLPLLSRVRIVDGDQARTAEFTYETVERR